MRSSEGRTNPTESRVADYIRRQIDALAGIKSQKDIALETGYERPNIISMFKTGEARIPIDKVPALAKALKVDPAFLFRLVLAEYWPGREETIARMVGTVCSRNEVEILNRIRELTDNKDPELTQALDDQLVKIFTR